MRRFASTSSDPGAPPMTLFIAIALACIAFGILVRFADASGKIYYQDEAVTSIRASGYLLADDSALFDGRLHTYDDVARLLRPAPGRGAGATIRSLAVEDPQHPPAFYALEALWMRVVGGSPLAVRMLAIVCGFLGLPLAYLLGVELFASRRVAYLAVSFFAISPFFVLYGYQAREYGLFATVTLLSTLLFVRAMRYGGAFAWVAYALSVALGIYVYLFSLFIVAAHAIAVLFGSERADRSRRLAAFAASAAGGFALASPWLAVVYANARSATGDVSWATTPYPLPFVVAKWLFFAGATFFDGEYVSGKLFVFAALVLLAIAYAVVAFSRDRAWSAWVKMLLFALGLTTFVVLAAGDLILHHRFSTIGRYLTPAWIALIFIVAAYLGERLQQRLPQAILALLVFCAVFADVVSARNASWWENSGNKSAPALVAYLEAHPGTLVVSEADYAPLLVIAPLMPPSATWLGYRVGQTPQIGATAIARNAYLLSPAQDVRLRVEREAHVRAQVVYDSHDFSSNLTRVRSATYGERAGRNDWGELVLWSLTADRRTSSR